MKNISKLCIIYKCKKGAVIKRRNITFKPICLDYGPLTQPPQATLKMNQDELEAIILADFKGLYQEQCAEQLGVSRPTFAKLLKSARKKSVEMLMYAKKIELVFEKQSFTMVFPTNDRISIHPHFITAKFFAFAKVEDDAISSIAYTDNPVYKEMVSKGIEIIDDESAKGLAAGRIIPPLLKKANIVLVHSLGEGMKRNIEGMGLAIELTDLTDIDVALETLI